MTTTRRQLTVAGTVIRWRERDGYIIERTCAQSHGGNRRLNVHAANASIGCTGCGTWYPIEYLLDQTRLTERS